MPLQESGEMYLETILILCNKNADVHAIDIAHYTGYSKPSVSRALGLLKNDNLVKINSGGSISLTHIGLKIAQKIYERHSLLTDFFIQLGVDEEIAVKDACKIEHHISEETFEKIKDHAIKSKKQI